MKPIKLRTIRIISLLRVVIPIVIIANGGLILNLIIYLKLYLLLVPVLAILILIKINCRCQICRAKQPLKVLLLGAKEPVYCHHCGKIIEFE